MAVTITAAALAGNIGVTETRAAELLDTATALIGRYMGTATFPDAIGNEAAVRCAGWMAAQPYASVRREDQGGVSTSYNPAMQSALRHSGAMALMSPWRVRRAGAIGGAASSTARDAGQTDLQPGDEGMPTLPSVKLYTVPLAIPDVTFATLPNMTGQEVVDAGAEVLAVTRQAISTAAPVSCYQQSFLYSTVNSFVVVAVPHGEDRPSHYRLKAAVVTNVWALPLPPVGGNLSNTWRASSGQAVSGGVSHDVFWWPALFADFPETTTFEWPL